MSAEIPFQSSGIDLPIDEGRVRLFQHSVVEAPVGNADEMLFLAVDLLQNLIHGLDFLFDALGGELGEILGGIGVIPKLESRPVSGFQHRKVRRIDVDAVAEKSGGSGAVGIVLVEGCESLKQTFDRAVGRVVKSEGDEFAVDVHVRYVGVRSVPYGGAFVIGGTFPSLFVLARPFFLLRTSLSAFPVV